MRAFLSFLGFGVVTVIQVAPPPDADRQSGAVATVVVATTSKGQPVLDLLPAQLTALVDDRPARVEYLHAVGRSLAVVLMFDVSRSMRMSGTLNQRVAQDFGATVVAPLRADDRVRFGEIGGGVAVGPMAPHTKAFFAAPPALVERLERPLLMSSPIWDGVAAGVAAVHADDRHRLVVLITDGLVAGSRLGLEDAIRLATAAQTAISVVDVHLGKAMVVKQDNQRQQTEFRPDEALRRLAAGTGGAYFHEVSARSEKARASDMPALVAKAIAESRGAYRVGLLMPADGAPHSVKITSNRPGLVIRTPPEIRR
jgi:hypothetical protein